MINAFLFDLNGTLIDDMQYHINAWHQILNKLGADISLEKTKEECYGKNYELLERIFPGRFTIEEKTKLSYEKERAYQQKYRPQLKLVEGLDKFLALASESGIKMAIGSAAIQFNIDFVIDGLKIRDYFSAIVSADDVSKSKPHPETYLKCAAALHLEPHECLVFEDVPKGVEAAANAGMKAVVITTLHKPEEFKNYSNIVDIQPDFSEWCQKANLNNLLRFDTN